MICNVRICPITGYPNWAGIVPGHTDVQAHIVPRTVIQYVKYLLRGNSNVELFMAKAITNILQALEDEALQIPDRWKLVRIRSLAMISTCKAIHIFEMTWSPSTFSWSCLKPPGFDLIEVSVVSPLVQEAFVQYTLENPNYLLDVASVDFFTLAIKSWGGGPILNWQGGSAVPFCV